MSDTPEDDAPWIGPRFMLGAWLLSALALGAVVGSLRLSSTLTPLRTGAPVVAAPAPSPATPAASAPAEPIPTTPAAPPAPPAEIWTYKASEREYRTVSSLEDVPPEFRSNAVRMR